jgi:hypothetical protein
VLAWARARALPATTRLDVGLADGDSTIDLMKVTC